MLVDGEITLGPDLEVEQAVVGERREQVVEEPDAGLDRGGPGAVCGPRPLSRGSD